MATEPKTVTEPTIEFSSQGSHPDPTVLECGTTLAVRGVYNISGTAIHGTQGVDGQLQYVIRTGRQIYRPLALANPAMAEGFFPKTRRGNDGTVATLGRYDTLDAARDAVANEARKYIRV